jgi:hypothetical protein
MAARLLGRFDWWSGLESAPPFSQIWELASGTLLCSLVFPAAVTSVVVDPAEFTLVAGASTGALYNVSLYVARRAWCHWWSVG